MKTALSQAVRITGIGSLPHHNVDAALEYCFKYGIPFLPQIPIRNPWEFMLAQALEGLPGLQLESEGQVCLNLEVWKRESHRLDQRLKAAFSRPMDDRSAFESFEPTAAVSACWQPFLWELRERGHRVAKLQIAGPLTAEWSLRLKDQTPADRNPELSGQIFRLILARSLSWVHRMISDGIQPLLFIDEPGLYALSLSHPKHVLAIQELKWMIQTLQKAGAQVGVHCCSNTLWETVLGLGLDYLSLDVQLSLAPALRAAGGEAMAEFHRRGGSLALGVIPTTRSSVLPTLNPQTLSDSLLRIFAENWESHMELVPELLKRALFTPACGLALHSTSDAELVLEKLVKVYESFHFT